MIFFFMLFFLGVHHKGSNSWDGFQKKWGEMQKSVPPEMVKCADRVMIKAVGEVGIHSKQI